MLAPVQVNRTSAVRRIADRLHGLPSRLLWEPLPFSGTSAAWADDALPSVSVGAGIRTDLLVDKAG